MVGYFLSVYFYAEMAFSISDICIGTQFQCKKYNFNYCLQQNLKIKKIKLKIKLYNMV